VPDGLGVTYGNRFVQESETVLFDDSLVLHLTKKLGNDLPRLAPKTASCHPLDPPTRLLVRIPADAGHRSENGGTSGMPIRSWRRRMSWKSVSPGV
jgi:hypothetical protein